MDAKINLNHLIGKPFLDGARGPEAFDCWGLTVAAMRLYGYSLPEFFVSAFDCASIAGAIESQRYAWEELAAPLAGCVIVMKLGGQPYNNHIATFIGGGMVLHTRQKTGSIIERIEKPIFKALVQGYYLPPKVYKNE